MEADSLRRLRGKFIVFDGVEGTGKDAQIRLLGDALTAETVKFVVAHDPGGTPIGDRIRHVLLDYDLSDMDVICEAFLFMASRAQLTSQVIDPALSSMSACLCNRYISATCAYQGAAGLDPKRIVELAKFAVGNTWPHLTIVLDVPPEVGFKRTGLLRAEPPRNKKLKILPPHEHIPGQHMLFGDARKKDAMEARPMEFHERVRERFLELPSYYPAPVAIVDGTGTVDEVQTRVREALADAAL